MSDDERIGELLLLWEECRDRGERVTVSKLCRDCPELIPKLEAQIRALGVMDQFLGGTNFGDETEISGDPQPATAVPVPAAQSMSTKSQYQVLRSHARGGLGEVLVAHDERLGRDVALKVMRQPHDLDPVRRRRFVREAEITSRLEHPGIVPVHGIGEDADGRLCYAMRLISGETLHQAIEAFHRDSKASGDDRARNLAFHQLLGRFVSVCNTIAYAHSQGVLHRDLKPANIMLGAFGETLVVDWGLAKRLDVRPKGELPEAGYLETIDSGQLATTSQPDSAFDAATQVGQTLGTPSFMSPEQSRGDADIAPASDIYCLGATFYMLLTGQPPFVSRNVAEILVGVQRGDFPAPHKLDARIPKPLEAICLKAMALRPSERYPSALDMATDIERWLADQPVSAYRDPLLVRSGRWMRRHRLLVASGSAALLVALASLVVLLVVTTSANERLRTANELEKKARGEAVANAQTATKNAQLAENQSDLALRSLQSVTFDIQRQLRNVPAAHKVRRSLLDTALRGLAEVAAKLEQRPQIDRGLITAHRDLGDVFFEVGSEAGTGGTESARVQFQRAFDIAQKLASAAPTDREAQRELATCYDRLGDIASRSGSSKAAEEHYQAGLQIREQLVASDARDEKAKRDVSISLNRLGDLSLQGGAVEAARDLYRRSLDIRLEQAMRKVVDDFLQRDLIISYHKVGDVILRLGDTQEAMRLFGEGLKLSQRTVADHPDDDVAQRDLTNSFERLGNVSWVLGNFQASADYYRQSHEITTRRAAADPTNTMIRRDLMQASSKMVDAMTKLGKAEEAQKYLDQVISICEQLVAADPEDNRAMRDLAIAYSTKGEASATTPDEAVEWYRKSLTLRKQRAAADPTDRRAPSDVAFGLTKLGDGLLATKQVDQALASYAEALQIHRQRCEANPSDRLAQSNLAAYYQRIGVACRRAGKFDQAAENYKQGLKIAEKLSVDDVNDVPVRIMMLTFYHALGILEQSRQRFPQAMKWYEQGLQLAQQLSHAGKLVGDDATWVAYIQDAMRNCEDDEKKSKELPQSKPTE